MTIDLSRAKPTERSRMPLLDLDASLAGAIVSEHIETARRALAVEVLDLAPGPWRYTEVADDCFGYLIGQGFMTREVSVLGSQGVEPLGPGDLIRPWEEEAVSFAAAEFTVLTPARLAILDRDAVRRAGYFP